MEIERKYLVKKEVWQLFDKPAGEKIIQGYLSTDINKTIRVRLKGSSGFMTIKGKTDNISREEIEFPVPAGQVMEIIEKFSEGVIDKIRYTLSCEGKIWEVDEFMDDNEGLLLAEIELQSEDESFDLPEWVGPEVSHDIRYFNSNLSKKPFKNWNNK
jgi:CYTH domain-containing protein